MAASSVPRPTGRLTESACSTLSQEITDEIYSQLGIKLDMKNARLQQILSDNHYRVRMASLRMLIEFKQSKASEGEAYSVLHKALGDLTMIHVRGKLEEVAGDAPNVVMQANGPISHPEPESGDSSKQPLENVESIN